MGKALPALRLTVRDRTAFLDSIRQVCAWDFDRVIVGHGDIVETGGKPALRQALLKSGLVV